MNTLRTYFPLLVAIFMLLPLAAFSQDGGATDADPGLVAVGSLSASNLYLSYLVLGTVADGYQNESYEAELAKSIALETIFLNTNSRQALEDLLSSGIIAEEEGVVVNEMIQSYTVLENMARALISFIEDEDDSGAAYQVFRMEAWDRISALLGI